ncbi:glycosyltransferase [Paracoccus sp. (in: a-proteobacteria)]|uniref:glycosyltransferase n=1 Tax=Paracoccus sp. TaxID=267 RepID=UPI00396D02BE
MPVEGQRTLRIAMICPPLPSHLRAFEGIAAALRVRGHDPIFVTEPQVAVDPGFPTVRLPDEAPPNRGLGFWASIRQGALWTDRLCRHGPAILERLKVDMILGDQTEPAAGLLGAALKIPMISVACALPFNPEPGIPLPYLSWPYDRSEAGLKRNKGGAQVARLLMTPHRRVVREWAEHWGLGPRESFEDCLSPLLTLAQVVPGFEHPRPDRGANMALLGPLRRPDPQVMPEGVMPDPARPLVYVSLGTLQGHRWRLLARIVRACHAVGAQVLVSHGGGLDARNADRIPADWVLDFVPQQAVLGHADLCVTHAGLNTALECLAQGVPMLALPLAYDQPGVAARIGACGAGLWLKRTERSQARIEAALLRLLTEPGFRATATRFARDSAGWLGAEGAVQQIERVMQSLPARAPLLG